MYINKEKPDKFDIEQTLNFEDGILYTNSVFSNGQLYNIHSSSNNVWIEPKLSRKGNNSMAFQLHPGESRKETIVTDIPNNSIKYIAFSVYFPSNYKIPNDWNLFAQWWQGSPASPPVAFQIEPNIDDFRLNIITRNGTSKNFNRVSNYSGLIEKDEWVDFIIKLRVDDKKGDNGLLKVWKNNKLIVDYKGKLGYTDLNDKTSFRFGLYRSHKNSSTIEAYYDEIFIGDELK